jgi:hypothetical protein
LQVLEKDLAGDVVAIALFLKRLAGPIGEDRMPEIQDRFVYVRDDGEHGEFDIFLRVPAITGVIRGGADSRPDLGAEGGGVGYGLAVAAEPLADCQQFLKDQGKVLGSRG